MAPDVRVYILAGLAGLLVAGIAMGAESQRETFLQPDVLQDLGLRDAAGNLVALTALIPAVALAVAAVLISRRPGVQRILPGLAVFAAAYPLMALLQSSWPNYDAFVQARTASFSITPLISNGAAVASVFLAPMCILLALGWIIQQAMARLHGTPGTLARPGQALRRFMAAYLLAVPFLLVLALGSLRLLFDLPDESPATVPYTFVFPVSALAALALVGVGAVKVWQLGAFTRNGRLADSVADQWRLLRKVEWALLGVLVGMGVLATFLAPVASPLLEAGRTFGVSARGHTQAQALLLLPMAGWLSLGHVVIESIERHRDRRATLEVGPGPWAVGALVTLGVTFAAGALTNWLAPGALWTWAVMLTPVVVFTWFLHPRAGLWPSAMLAVVLWGIGNTISGVFRLTEDADNALVLDANPGVLAMFRVLAVLVIAVAIGRLVKAQAKQMRDAWSVPSAILVATAAALLLYLEGSFTAWIAPQSQGEFVGIGSLVASQDLPVRVTIHILVGLPAIASGFVLARIHRPDWFQRRPGKTGALEPAYGDPYFHGKAERPTVPPGESAT